jgi:phage terminase Nu1 subunit (DNA packaging protein)
MSQADSIVKGLKAVAEHFGKSLRQVQRWVRDPSFPRLSGRRFDLHQIQAWLDHRDGRPAGGKALGEGHAQQPELPVQRGKDFEDARMKKARADLLELDLRQRRGELVERTEVEQLFVVRIMAVKQGLLNLARSLPPQLIHCLDERDMEEIIMQSVRTLLDDYSRTLPKHLKGEALPSQMSGSGISGG